MITNLLSSFPYFCLMNRSYWLALSLFFFSSRRRHTRSTHDWSSDVCSSDLAAVAAREDDDFQLIARTDARECTGIEDAIERANAYVEAGADCIFFEAPLNADEMRLVRDEVDAPLLANMVEGGKTPWFTVPELEEPGFGLVIYPLSGWMAAAAVLRELMKELRETGTTQGFWDRMGLQMGFEELFDLFDYPQFQSLEDRYVVR